MIAAAAVGGNRWLGCTSMSAQALGYPVRRRRGRGLRRIVKNQDQSAACLGAGGGEVHRRPARHDHVGTSRSPYHRACGGFQACLSRQRVPGLRARMPMCGRGHAWREDGLHILRGKRRSRADGKRAYLGDAHACGWTPTGSSDGQQPDFSKRFHNRSLCPLRAFRLRTRGIAVQVPEDRPRWKLAEFGIRDDPTPHLARPLAHRPTDLCRGLRTDGERQDDAGTANRHASYPRRFQGPSSDVYVI